MAQDKFWAKLIHAGKAVFNVKTSLEVSRSIIFKVKWLIHLGKDHTEVCRGKPPQKMRKMMKIAAAAEAVQKNPQQSICCIARGHGVS